MSLTRSKDERLIFGVCGGLAAALRVHTLVIRIAFVLLGMTWGLGIVAYVLLALLMDDEGAADDDDREVEERMADNGREVLSRIRELGGELREGAREVLAGKGERGPRQRQVGALLLIAGALIVLWSLGLLRWVSVPILVGGAALAIGAWLLLGQSGRPPRP